MNSKIKTKLKQGESTISIAEEDKIDLSIIEKEQQEYVNEIKRQALMQRITLRQSIRNNFPKALSKAIEIMNLDLEDLTASGATMSRTEHIQLLKVQLDSAKAIMGMANHVLGEDILTLWAEKEQNKKATNTITYQSEILADGSVKLTAKSDKEIINQAGVDKLELKIEDVL